MPASRVVAADVMLPLVNGLPRAILFDLDGTILSEGRRRLQLQDIADAHAHHFAPLTATQAADLMEQEFVAFWNDAERHREWRAKPLIETRRHLARRAFAVLKRAGAEVDDELANTFADRFHAHRQSQVCCFPGAVETLAELQRRGVVMALITNGTGEAQRGKIERWGLASYFHHIQIEGEHGFGKPEERAYRHAMAALGVAPGDCWMVGDNLEWEVAAPQRLGIMGVWVDPWDEGLPPGHTARPDRVIRGLSDLLG